MTIANKPKYLKVVVIEDGKPISDPLIVVSVYSEMGQRRYHVVSDDPIWKNAPLHFRDVLVLERNVAFE